MKNILFYLIGLTLLVSCNSHKNGQEEKILYLEKEWRFTTTDKEEYSLPDFRDSNWSTIEHGNTWERQGYEYDGFAWYRQRVFIPGSLKDPGSEIKGLTIKMGGIDDADEFFFNGNLLGNTGNMDKRVGQPYSIQREYIIPDELIQWNDTNVIAVRVSDYGGGGGLYGEEIFIRPSYWFDYITFNVDVTNENGIFKSKEAPGIIVNIVNDNPRQIKGVINANIYTSYGEFIKKHEEKIHLSKNENSGKKIEFSTLAPGFYLAEIMFIRNTNDDTVTRYQRFGIEPERIDIPLTRPCDFKNYWKQAKTELRAIPAKFSLEKMDTSLEPGFNTYLVKMNSLNNITIKGWYTLPVEGNHFPAILSVQGYSSNKGAGYRDGFATFALNIRGHGNSTEDINPGFPGYLTYNLEDKDDYIYRGAYMDCIRAVDFLVSREEIDTSKIGVKGGSQGGALSFATAALDGRIKLCLAHIPFLSSFREYFNIAPWPVNEFRDYVNINEDMDWEDVYAVLDYIDIKNLAPWIECPLLMGVGLNDMICPPTINFGAYNQVSSEIKDYRVYPGYSHSVDPSFFELEDEWINKYLMGNR